MAPLERSFNYDPGLCKNISPGSPGHYVGRKYPQVRKRKKYYDVDCKGLRIRANDLHSMLEREGLTGGAERPPERIVKWKMLFFGL